MATTSVDVALKGLKQTKVLRAMLRFETFTRKELANVAQEDISFVNGVLSRHKNLYRPVGHVRAHKVGAQEEVLTLRPGAEAELLQLLRPLYQEIQVEQASDNIAAQVPMAVEYKVARELVEEIQKTGNGRGLPEFQRVVTLLATASNYEGIRANASLDEDLIVGDVTLNDRQRISKAHIDFMRGKLCWLGQPLQNETRLFKGDPFSLGLAYLQNAAKTFRECQADNLVQSIDYWGMKYLTTAPEIVLSSMLNTKNLHKAASLADESVLPGIQSQIAKSWSPQADLSFMFVSEAIAGLRKESAHGTLLRLRQHGASYDLVDLVVDTPLADAADARVVGLDAPKMVEGLVNVYHAGYASESERTVGLVDIRPNRMSFAMIDPDVLLSSSEPVSIEELTDFRVEELRMGEISKKMGVFAERAVEKTEKYFKSAREVSPSKEPIEKLYVAGDPSLAKSFIDIARAQLRVEVELLDPLRSITVAEKAAGAAEIKKQICGHAAEIGLVVEGMALLKKPLRASGTKAKAPVSDFQYGS
jgi:hypothetical protein